jgi:hypothetical protein
MDRFEAVVKAAMKTVAYDDVADQPYDTSTAEALSAEAADQLILESTVEMSEATVDAVCGILLHVYKTGQHPGQGANKLLNELVGIVLYAREKQQHADHSDEDTY